MTSRLTFEVVAFQVIAFYPAPPSAEPGPPSGEFRDERAGGDGADAAPSPPDEADDH